MTQAIGTSDLVDASPLKVNIDRHPDTCPRCHHKILPNLVRSGFSRTKANGARIQVVYQCPNRDCLEFFIATYYQSANDVFALATLAPLKPHEALISEDIRNLSPTFEEILNQVKAAEAEGLQQLVGVGLRKALEFLIKDFLCDGHPDAAEEIKALPLAQCIDKYVTDEKIKSCAKRAAWLGNDETHYVRKWIAQDVSQLWTLIELTMHWINADILTKKFQANMPAPN